MKLVMKDEKVQALIIKRCETDDKFAHEVFSFLEPEMFDNEKARTNL